MVYIQEVGVKKWAQRAQESASACGGREQDPAAAPLGSGALQKSINIGL